MAQRTFSLVIYLLLGLMIAGGSPSLYSQELTPRAYAQVEETQTIHPTKDAYLILNNGASFNTNLLQIWWQKSVSGELKSDDRLLMNFDLATIADKVGDIESAELELTFKNTPVLEATGFQTGETNVFAYRQPKLDWEENRTNWHSYKGADCLPLGKPTCTYWQTPGGEVDEANGVLPKVRGRLTNLQNGGLCLNDRCKLAFDLKSHVEDAIDARDNQLSLLLRYDGTIFNLMQFYSKDAGRQQFWPVLKVRYKTEPPPTPCPVDITFVIDNSGSMDDHGADYTLRRLMRKLKNYFAPTFNTNRGAVFTFSYDGNARQHVRYDRENSLSVSIDAVRGLQFGADGSNIRSGLRAGSDYARNQSVNNRTQFIFVAGDEQTDGLNQEILDRISRDAERYGIKYYTFALRSGISSQPYTRIAEKGQGRFFKGSNFDGGAIEQALNEDGCRISGTKFHDRNGDGVRQVDETNPAVNEEGLGGWTIKLFDEAGGEVATTTTATNADMAGFYQFSGLDKSKKYRIVEVPSAQQNQEGWQQTTAQDSLEFPGERIVRDVGNWIPNTNPSPRIEVTSKTPDVPELAGNQTQTMVTVSFRVLNGQIEGAEIFERLASSQFQFVDPSAAKLLGPNGEIPLPTQPPQGGQTWTASGLTLPVGNYTLRFKVNYSGPFTPNPIPIDYNVASCTDSAHISYPLPLPPDTERIAGTSAVWSTTTNKAYIFGGYTRAVHSQDSYTNRILEYDPATNTTRVMAARLPSPRAGTSAVWDPVRNKAYIFGGHNSSIGYALKEVLEYDPVQDRVVTKSAVFPTTQQMAIYDEGSRRWISQVWDLSGITRTSAAWSAANGKAYIIGGEGSNSIGHKQNIFEYDPGTDTLRALNVALPAPKSGLTAIWDDVAKEVYIAGGRNKTPAITRKADGKHAFNFSVFYSPEEYKQVFAYSPVTNSLRSLDPMPLYYSRGSGAWNDGLKKVTLIGGANHFGEAYFPLDNTVSLDQEIATLTSPASTTEVLAGPKIIGGDETFADTSTVWSPLTNTFFTFYGYPTLSNDKAPMNTVFEYNPTAGTVTLKRGSLGPTQPPVACEKIPPGAITKRAGKLTIEADSWLATASLSPSNTFAVGDKALVITGGANTQSGQFVKVESYGVPTTGQLEWNQIRTIMQERVSRAIQTGTAKIWQCPGGGLTLNSGTLYLNSDTSPLQPPQPGKKSEGIWVLKNNTSNNCAITLNGNVTYEGTGTLVNQDGTLVVRGSLIPANNQQDVLGYVSFAGTAAIYDQSVVRNTYIYTGGNTNGSGGAIQLAVQDGAVSNVVPREWSMKVIAQTIVFPAPNTLRTDITIKAVSDLLNRPPLLQQFEVPDGREVP